MCNEARCRVEISVGGFIGTEEVASGVGEGAVTRSIGAGWELGNRAS